MAKQNEQIKWWNFSEYTRLVEAGMSGEEAYEKAYGPSLYPDDAVPCLYAMPEEEQAYFIQDHSDTTTS